MDIEDRVRYYMGKWYDTNITIENPEQYTIKERTHDTLILLTKSIMYRYPEIIKYSKYLVDTIDEFQGKPFLYTKGDQVHRDKDLPILAKVTDLAHAHIILKLNHFRHWGLIPSVSANDIHYVNKKNSIVWRGVTTGWEKRTAFVKKFYDHPTFNIGFSGTCQNITIPPKQLKNILSIKEQLQYKFILSVEGNDVATGLKWQLYSNSVVIMRKPSYVSWAMEDTLIPYVHYLPVKDDYSDLEEVFQWGLAHEKECIAITKAAKAFIQQFLDEKKEIEIHRRIIRRYIANVTIPYIPTTAPGPRSALRPALRKTNLLTRLLKR